MNLQQMAGQRQGMPQRAIQSAEILQMNTQELTAYLKQQELENPLVELEDIREETAAVSRQRRKLEWLNSADEQNRGYYGEEFEEEQEREAWNVSREDEGGLAEYVFSQLSPLSKDEREESILYFMANSLDSRGYLTESLHDMAERFEMEEAEMGGYLYMLQSAEPAGVGARNLRECLLLQLDRMAGDTSSARRIVMECLELLGENKLSRISQVLGLPMETVTADCRLVQSLNPKPGSGFSERENLRYIQPDVTVVKFKDYFQVIINDTAYPGIRIQDYYRIMLQEDVPEETKEYIRNKQSQAEWLIRCVEHRKDTLAEVTKAMVEWQHLFFENGPRSRQPMTLADIAGKTGLHETTVGQAIRDKYIQCSWGIFPMNYFFPRPSGFREEAETLRGERVKGEILHIVEEEDKRKPLSDQKITEKLLAAGVQISRRTVTKYRIEMGIPEASERKTFE